MRRLIHTVRLIAPKVMIAALFRVRGLVGRRQQSAIGRVMSLISNSQYLNR